MPLIRSFIRLFFSHAFFVSFCAAALSLQTFWLSGQAMNRGTVAMVFFATLAGYNFCILAIRLVNRQRLFTAQALLSMLLMLLSSAIALLYIMEYAASIPYMATAAALTFIYVMPRMPLFSSVGLQRIGFMKTLILAGTWTGVTVLVPLSVTGELSGIRLLQILPGRFFFMLILCILFDSRDTAVDSIRGLNTIATDLTRKQVSGLLLACFILYFISVSLLDISQAAGLWVAGAAGYGVFLLSRKTRGYYFYYFLVDGMMLFSAIMTYMATFWLFC